jgi:hypothetical protein
MAIIVTIVAVAAVIVVVTAHFAYMAATEEAIHA